MNIYKAIQHLLSGRYTITYLNQSLQCRDLLESEYATVTQTYSLRYDEALKRGLLSDQAIIRQAIQDGRWEESYDIDAMKKQELMLKTQIQANRFKLNIADNLRTQLQALTKERQSLESQYNALFDMRAASYAASVYVVYAFVSASLDSTIDLLTQEDYFKIYQVMLPHLFTIRDIRQVARHGVWFQKYRAAKDHLLPPLFPDALHMTYYQSLLLTWSATYDYALNSMDRPSFETIENDDAFDTWLENDRKKQCTTQEQQGGSVFVPADKRGAKRVYEMNNQASRREAVRTLRLVKQQGKMTEAERARLLGKKLLN